MRSSFPKHQQVPKTCLIKSTLSLKALIRFLPTKRKRNQIRNSLVIANSFERMTKLKLVSRLHFLSFWIKDDVDYNPLMMPSKNELTFRINFESQDVNSPWGDSMDKVGIKRFRSRLQNSSWMSTRHCLGITPWIVNSSPVKSKPMIELSSKSNSFQNHSSCQTKCLHFLWIKFFQMIDFSCFTCIRNFQNWYTATFWENCQKHTAKTLHKTTKEFRT